MLAAETRRSKTKKKKADAPQKGRSEYERTVRYANVLLHGIKNDPMLSQADYFTREALVHRFADTPAFGRISTISRYSAIREGVTLLLEQGLLTQPGSSRLYLCLPNRVRAASRALQNDIPLHERYHQDIFEIIQEWPKQTVDVMAVVRYWADNSSTRLMEDSRRILVRHTLRWFARQGLLEENDDFSYTITARAKPSA